MKTTRSNFKGKSKIVIEKDGVWLSLPKSDAQIMKAKKPEHCDMFLPMHSAKCLVAEAGGVDLREMLPEGVWVQEMNMLAYTLQQFDLQQMESFQKKVSTFVKMYPGEMLNLALSICPESAGFEKSGGAHPQYTGENLFELMEYKRFQDWRQEHPSFQIVKFYFPIEVVRNSDHSSDFVELSAAEAVAYQTRISEMFARNMQPDNCWSDWECYEALYELAPYKDHGLLYERPDVEVWNGELWGVIVAGVGRLLTEMDIEVLKEHFNGGIWDGWGEGSLNIRIPEGSLRLFLSDCTEIRQQAKGELILTEREMFLCQAPYFSTHLQNRTGWKPDFRKDKEYGKEHPIWLELSCDRRSVRVPLPAKSSRVSEELKKIRTAPEQIPHIKLKAPGIFPINDLRLLTVDLPMLNQIAENAQKMGKEENKKLYEMLLKKKWKGENRVEGVKEILETFRSKGEEGLEIDSMNIDIRQL